MSYNDVGTLIVKTYTAGEALPVANAVVRIIGAEEDNRFSEFSLLTDIDGLTPRISLPAPRKNISLSPNPTSAPYARYKVEVSADGYYPKIINNVALFSAIDTFLPVNMIPLAVYKNGVDFPRNTLNSTVEENPYL